MKHSIALLSALLLTSQPDTPPATEDKDRAALPIREVTVFKDGHAFVVHRGSAATDGAGNVVLDELPRPVLGTFWAFAGEGGASLRSVAAGPRKVSRERAALDVRGLLEANPGADVIVVENGLSYSARIEGIPVQQGEDLAPDTTGEVVWLRTADGVRVVPLAHISHVTFRGDFRKTLPREEVQDRLTLCLDWHGGAPAPAAEVGMMYLQKGLRWIPSYRITIDGAGRAEVELQGTLINELADLEDVTANLVVGVPAFAFADTLDPIAIQRTAAALSPYFDNGSQTRYALSNAIMTQAARMTEVSATPGTGEAAIPELLGDLPSGRTEDLFVFSIGGITLAKGERMVVPVRKVTIPYEDVYHLDLPAVPPVEACASLDQQRRTELASLLAAPKVMHALRLTNDADCPLTTAPALVLREGRVLAQSMLTYTAARAATDLDLTAAVDVRVAKEEDETERVPSAEQWRNEKFMRVDLAGRITLQSFAKKPLRIEVTRHVLGAADEASEGGRIAQRNAFELEPGDVGGPSAWWSHWSLPWWWHHWNGVGRIAWEVELTPGESVELGYRWHYYWK